VLLWLKTFDASADELSQFMLECVAHSTRQFFGTHCLAFRIGAWAEPLYNANDRSRHGASNLYAPDGDAMRDKQPSCNCS